MQNSNANATLLPDFIEFNLEPGRFPSIPYANRDQARRGLPDQSDFYYSLVDNWQVSSNPTEIFQRDFVLPPKWNGKQVFAYFEGHNPVFEFWVNGKLAGAIAQERANAEFNITPYLKSGLNRLRVRRFGTQNYPPNVYLWAVAAVHIRDFRITTMPSSVANPSGWLISIQPKMRNLGAKLALNHRIESMLFDARGIPVWIGPLGVMVSLEPGEEIVSEFSYRVKKARPWLPHDPYFYTLILEMRDADGTLLDLRSARVGFAQSES